MNHYLNLVLLADVNALKTDDYVGFTFFIGFMAMFAASVFFFMEMPKMEGKWKTSVLISGIITMIAAAHYWYMRDYWLANQTSPTAFRYIDWILTVPLMCVEFYLILKAFGAKIGLLWKMIFYSIWMLVTGYLGETVFRDNSALWGAISTLGYVGILYEIWLGSARKLAASSNDPILMQAFNTLCWFVLVGWAIYPIGYMAIETDGWLSSVIAVKNMDLIYNIGDAVNKIGFGLVIYSLAVASKDKTYATA
ncbi:MAG: bacteriorhodopsin-like [Microscillaceae bacterium]|jgi:bacteriorhodopsin|nr:bacteriorhodopsin-like [Microscillaceae bacterium]